MAIDQATEQVFRQYETTVLDVHHQVLPLWGLERPKAIYALLAQHDSYALVELLAPPAPQQSMGVTQMLKALEEGLTQAIRWLHPGHPPVDVVPTSDRKIIEKAGAYASFASKYVDIADMHKMYGRGQMTFTIPKEKLVRFEFLKQGITPVIGYAEATRRVNRSPIATNPERLKAICKGLFDKITKNSYHYADGHIVIDDHKAINDPAVRDLMDFINPPEELLIPEATDLLGFTVAEFLDYYLALRRWSFCATFLFISLVLNGTEQSLCMPTQVVPRASFLDRMEALSGLARAKVEAITQRLTYDNRTPSPDLFQQPLICGNHHVAWSARVVERSRQVRNMLKLMARTPATKNDAATIIGSRDRAMLNELGELLAKQGGCSYKIMMPIAHNANHGEVDLLAYNWKCSDELLVVEGKALLGVDEINEVDAATKEMQHAQKQLASVVPILQAIPDEQKKELFKFVRWDRVKQYYGIVVAQDAEPNDKYDHSVYPGISLATIKVRLRENHFASPRKFWEACKERRWLKAMQNYDQSHMPVKVGDVTYELPVMSVPNPLYSKEASAKK